MTQPLTHPNPTQATELAAAVTELADVTAEAILYGQALDKVTAERDTLQATAAVAWGRVDQLHRLLTAAEATRDRYRHQADLANTERARLAEEIAELRSPNGSAFDARVLAILAVLGWPDDRAASAHVEPEGYEITSAGSYWSLAADAVFAATTSTPEHPVPVPVTQPAEAGRDIGRPDSPSTATAARHRRVPRWRWLTRD